MAVKMRQIGNSQGFIVPALLRELGFGDGAEYELIRVGDSLLVTRSTLATRTPWPPTRRS